MFGVHKHCFGWYMTLFLKLGLHVVYRFSLNLFWKSNFQCKLYLMLLPNRIHISVTKTRDKIRTGVAVYYLSVFLQFSCLTYFTVFSRTILFCSCGTLYFSCNTLDHKLLKLWTWIEGCRHDKKYKRKSKKMSSIKSWQLQELWLSQVWL